MQNYIVGEKGMKYLNLEQRIINMYRDTFPAFVPVTGEAVSERAQKQFYDFLKSIYQKLYKNPDLLFTSTHEDDAHTYRFNKSADKSYMDKLTGKPAVW